MQELVVPAGEQTKGLENFLKKQFPIGYVRKLFRKNGARLNGRRAKAGDAIAAGDRIQLYIPFEAKKYPTHPSRLRPVIDIIYQDEALLVINKPAGLAVHEGRTVRKEESLAGWVAKEFHTRKFSPRLVHRLDKDTSGLLLLAKDEKTLSALEGQFETGATAKEYLCLVAGRLPHNEGKIDFPLPGRDGNLARALTRYRVLKRFSETTLARVAIETGRLHQIRLHFAKLGYPVVMDDQHGDFNFNKRFRKAYGLRRQFLHAEKLAVDYAGKRLSWRAPLAQDLEKILQLMENH